MISKQLVSGKKYRKGGSVSRVNEAGNYTKPTMRKRLFESIKAGGKGGKPHRVLRTADYLFALKLCGRTVEEYQAEKQQFLARAEGLA